MRVPTPRLYLGTMTFGWTGQTSSVVDEAASLEMTQMFIDHCRETSSSWSQSLSAIHIDTARVYSSGATEGILGSVLRQIKLPSSSSLSSSGSGVLKETIIVGSKAHPSWEDGGLSPHGIRSSFTKSIHEINNNSNSNDVDVDADVSINSFGEYYLHQPDTKHPLLESLQCIHELVSDGLIKSFGMSNYHATEMKRAFDICHEHGLTKPTVCQSLYNPLNRAVERELIPLLNANGCSFVAYNPLAAGLLTGKHQKSAPKSTSHKDHDENDENDDGVKQGRFKNNPNYLPRFYNDANFDAVEIIKQACDKENITLVDATFKWLLRHSALGPNDGVLLGASSVPQLRQNLDACWSATEEGDKGQLSDDIIAAFDAAAKITEKGAFPYWRSFSEDMPGREGMDQGASYSAAKQK